MSLTVIRRRLARCEAVFITAQNLLGAVRGGPVLDHILEPGVALSQDALDCELQEASLIVGRRHDREDKKRIRTSDVCVAVGKPKRDWRMPLKDPETDAEQLLKAMPYATAKALSPCARVSRLDG